LHFEGAGQKTKVFVYTTEVGSHKGGYDEWFVDITEAVNEFSKSEICQKQFKGKIPISIRSDNSRDLEMIPSNLSDFNLYGGIYRYLNLIYQPAMYIETVNAHPVVNLLKKTGTVSFDVKMTNKSNSTNGTIDFEVMDQNGKLVNKTQISVNQKYELNNAWKIELKNPQLWSPSNPALFTCKVTLKTDAGTSCVTQKFGFRNFQFMDSGPFMLNGQRLLLRGTHRHEDHAGVGAAMTEEMIRTEMLMMKQMGVNFIRLGHYQQSRIVLDLCDSLGILVWEEIPWCRGGLGGSEYQNMAKDMLTDMIAQHQNHPAIIIWGLGNENDWAGDFQEFDKNKIIAFMKELNSLSHSLDSTRKTAIRRCDFCKNIVDVYSPSIWAGWYRGIYTDYKETSEKEMKTVKHFLHVEWGGDSHAGRYSENPDNVLLKIESGKGADERLGDASLYNGAARVSKDGDWSESYICNLIDWHLKEQEDMPWLTGSAYWPFKDFSTPIRRENPVPYMNQKGVIERDFTKKEAFFVFQSYWSENPMIHIHGHSWPVRWGEENESKMIKVYSNCEKVELFLNGKSMGVKIRNSKDFPSAGLRWNVVFQKGANHIKTIGYKQKITITDEINIEYQTEKWEKPNYLKLTKKSQQQDTATIEVKLYDKNNILCLDAKQYVYFSLSGDGKLIDNMGTSSGSRMVQVYNGRAIIRVKLNSGKSIVSVKSDGLKTEILEL